MSQIFLKQKSKTSFIYIDNNPYIKLSNMAINANFHSRSATTTARFLQFVIDNYGE